jgi:hypothetical protein
MLAFAMMAVIRHRAKSGSAKNNAERRQKQKHRHTVIDPRRATALTASSSFGIQSVLRECDCIPVVQQSASAYVVRE